MFTFFFKDSAFHVTCLMTHLYDLPPEILYTVHLHAVSESFPVASKHLYQIFKYASAHHKALYLIKRAAKAKHLICSTSHDDFPTLLTPFRENRAFCPDEHSVGDRKAGQLTTSLAIHENSLLTRLVSYAICDRVVLEHIHARGIRWLQDLHDKPDHHTILSLSLGGEIARRQDYPGALLPRRLFKKLPALESSSMEEAKKDSRKGETIAFIEHLISEAKFDPDSHDGYALAKALHCKNMAVVTFLLLHGADPWRHDGYAVRKALQARRFRLVFKFIEHVKDLDEHTSKNTLTKCLDIALKVQAWEIVDKLREKGAVPSMTALKSLQQPHVEYDTPIKKRRRTEPVACSSR